MVTGGITIGPILNTLGSAKKERELWFGSYMFSWLMESLCGALNKKGCNIILPTLRQVGTTGRVGLYPDRLYFTSENSKEEIAEWITAASSDFVNTLYGIYKSVHARWQTGSNPDESKVKKIIDDYLQIKWFVADGKVTIEEALKHLETAELYTLADDLLAEEPCDRCRMLPHTLVVSDRYEESYGQKLYLCPICAIKYGAHVSGLVSGKTGIKDTRPFPSIVHIGAREIADKLIPVNKVEADRLFDEQNQKLIAEGSKYLSYFAVLCLDMDNAGKLLAGIQDDSDKVKEFSDALYRFNTEVADLITAYGGETIYAGGDDILALIPARNIDSRLSPEGHQIDNLLALVDLINKKFGEVFHNGWLQSEGGGEYPRLSLSFGISMQYLKYPLKDALQSAYSCLFDKAKLTKNTLSMVIRKHAGATFEISLDLADLPAHLEVFTAQMNENSLPKGFYDSLGKIADKLSRTKVNRIDALLKNHFNEEHHKEVSGEFENLKAILSTDLNKVTKVEDKEAAVESIVNLYRLAKLLER